MGRAGGFRVLPSCRTPARDQQLDDPAALTVGAPFADTPSSRWVAVSTDAGTGVTTPLTYDPCQGGGARFDDLDADGAAEFLHVSVGDGGPGDQGPAADGEILLVNGQSVRFFEVVDASLDGLIGQEQGLAPVLDFTAFSPAQSVQATLVLSREADFDAITGFYRGLDAQCTVRDAAGNLLRPARPAAAAPPCAPTTSSRSCRVFGSGTTNPARRRSPFRNPPSWPRLPRCGAERSLPMRRPTATASATSAPWAPICSAWKTSSVVVTVTSTTT